MKPLRTLFSRPRAQHGAAMMVMLVIMIMGVSFFLVNALSKVTLQNARNEKSSDLLVQAKEVIMGYILAGDTLRPPGMMMFPDVLDRPAALELRPDGTQGSNYDGETEGGCFNYSLSSAPTPYTPLTSSAANMPDVRCIGRLPWKSLGMSISAPSENDPTGFMPWFAFSRNLIDPNTKINSELLNINTRWLKVYNMNGTLRSDRVAFVVIIPGPPLSGQSRPTSPPLGDPAQYLDSISIPEGCIGAACLSVFKNYDLTEKFITGEERRWMDDPANPGKQIEDPTYQFNDKVLFVTIDDLMPLIEKRIAREVKACLDDYANALINVNHKYPWPALVSDASAFDPPIDPGRAGAYDVLFGRLSEKAPNTSLTSGGGTPPTGTLLSLIQTVQDSLDNYIGGTGTLHDLNEAGDDLKDFAANGTPAHDAGNTADNCTDLSCTSLLQSQLNTAMGLGPSDTTMPTSWSSVASCKKLIIDSSYWSYWRDLVFYQVASGYQPGGAGSCTTGTTCLSVNGTGNTSTGSGTYHAAVSIAGKILPGVPQARPSTASGDYLEAAGGNAHTSIIGASPAVTFTTYKPSDTTNYPTVNDVVLCLDGKSNCK